ncbi:bleomycin resistance protein [Gemmatimonadetes bacterium T265]|nr:bleomycin resistance protein [Gemmatimonadetes bacterium T265]GJG89670.1 bleomycin resistance protein [Gemmatimonadetes bacterium T265]
MPPVATPPAAALAIPTLPSRSLASTLAFYRRLGFDGAVHPASDDGYAILTRGDVELHFFAHPALRPAESHAGCYIRVGDADAWFTAASDAGLPRAGIPRLDPIGDAPWGMREFAVVDEDGNLLRIGQAVSPPRG